MLLQAAFLLDGRYPRMVPVQCLKDVNRGVTALHGGRVVLMVDQRAASDEYMLMLRQAITTGQSKSTFIYLYGAKDCDRLRPFSTWLQSVAPSHSVIRRDRDMRQVLTHHEELMLWGFQAIASRPCVVRLRKILVAFLGMESLNVPAMIAAVARFFLTTGTDGAAALASQLGCVVAMHAEALHIAIEQTRRYGTKYPLRRKPCAAEKSSASKTASAAAAKAREVSSLQ